MPHTHVSVSVTWFQVWFIEFTLTFLISEVMRLALEANVAKSNRSLSHPKYFSVSHIRLIALVQSQTCKPQAPNISWLMDYICSKRKCM